MTALWNSLSLTVVDFLLGFLLRLPPTAAIAAVSIGSGLILTLARRFTTDQATLAIAAADRKVQQQLARAAKARGDNASAQRHLALRNQISLLTLRQEGKPLLVSLLPIALLATWAVERLEFHPPLPGEDISIAAYVPRRLTGQTMHIVPANGLTAEPGWISPIVPGELMGIPCGVARWTLRTDSPGETPLHFRLQGQTLNASLRTGALTYAPPRLWFPEHEIRIDTELRQVKPFGIVPGIPALMFPPWLVAYVLLVIPSVLAAKKLLRIH